MRTDLFWIEGPWPGRLAIMPRPRGGDWLEDEIRAWQTAGVKTIVSALEPSEAAELDLASEENLSHANGMDFVSIPITDRGVPASVPALLRVLLPLERELSDGRQVAIHCRQGIGRSSLLAAGLLTLGGVSPEDAWQRIERARGRAVPDTPEQRSWLIQLLPTAAKDLAGTG